MRNRSLCTCTQTTSRKITGVSLLPGGVRRVGLDGHDRETAGHMGVCRRGLDNRSWLTESLELRTRGRQTPGGGYPARLSSRTELSCCFFQANARRYSLAGFWFPASRRGS